MIETIQQAIKPHDKYQVEIKLDYELLGGHKTHYQVSTYIFVSQNLGITPRSYSQDEFYRDVQNYIRLKTPALILRDFTSSANSPLVRIANIVAIDNWSGDPVCNERLINNFKFMSAMLKSSLRDHLDLVQRRINEAPPQSKINYIIQNLVEEFLVESKRITQRYRPFYTVFNLPNVDDRVFTAYRFTDESISLLIEENAIDLFRITETYLKKSNKVECMEALSELAEREVKHRRSMGYASILKEDSDNEKFIYRSSVLKKYASSVLFLSTAVRREGENLEQILFAVAAGLSMIFATIVAFYFTFRFGEFTLPVFVALVVGYMFKDRIKEVGRAISARYLRRTLYDRRITIRTLDGKHQLGFLREKVAFVDEDEIPDQVLATRDRDHITDLHNDGRGEYVIHYAKEIILFTDAFKDLFFDAPEISGINDIMRYDIRPFLRKMAEPVQRRSYLENGDLQAADCHKVYHLNIVSKYKSIYPEKDVLYKRIRLVLNQEGIKRVEHVVT